MSIKNIIPGDIILQAALTASGIDTFAANQTLKIAQNTAASASIGGANLAGLKATIVGVDVLTSVWDGTKIDTNLDAGFTGGSANVGGGSGTRLVNIGAGNNVLTSSVGNGRTDGLLSLFGNHTQVRVSGGPIGLELSCPNGTDLNTFIDASSGGRLELGTRATRNIDIGGGTFLQDIILVSGSTSLKIGSGSITFTGAPVTASAGIYATILDSLGPELDIAHANASSLKMGKNVTGFSTTISGAFYAAAGAGGTRIFLDPAAEKLNLAGRSSVALQDVNGSDQIRCGGDGVHITGSTQNRIEVWSAGVDIFGGAGGNYLSFDGNSDAKLSGRADLSLQTVNGTLIHLTAGTVDMTGSNVTNVYIGRSGIPVTGSGNWLFSGPVIFNGPLTASSNVQLGANTGINFINGTSTRIQVGGSTKFQVDTTIALNLDTLPSNDNSFAMGTSGNRFSSVYSVNTLANRLDTAGAASMVIANVSSSDVTIARPGVPTTVAGLLTASIGMLSSGSSVFQRDNTSQVTGSSVVLANRAASSLIGSPGAYTSTLVQVPPALEFSGQAQTYGSGSSLGSGSLDQSIRMLMQFQPRSGYANFAGFDQPSGDLIFYTMTSGSNSGAPQEWFRFLQQPFISKSDVILKCGSNASQIGLGTSTYIEDGAGQTFTAYPGQSAWSNSALLIFNANMGYIASSDLGTRNFGVHVVNGTGTPYFFRNIIAQSVANAANIGLGQLASSPVGPHFWSTLGTSTTAGGYGKDYSNSYGLSPYNRDASVGLKLLGGQSYFAALADPSNIQATASSAGATTYTYQVVAIDRNGYQTISGSVTITNGQATLTGATGSNYNTVSWARVSGAVWYDVFRSSVYVGSIPTDQLYVKTDGSKLTGSGLTFRDASGSVAAVTGFTNLTVSSSQYTFNNPSSTAATYYYWIVGFDSNRNIGGIAGPVSAQNGPLDFDNHYIGLAWTGSNDAVGYQIYRSIDNSSFSNARVIGTTELTTAANGISNTFVDYGYPGRAIASPSGRNKTADMKVDTQLTAFHLVGASGSAGRSTTVTAGGGAGSGATVSAVGTDSAGCITVVTAGSPAANAPVVVLNFAQLFDTIPYMVISPANGNAAALGTTSQVFADQVNASVSGSIVKAGSAALTTTTTYKWNYHVIG